MFRYPRLSQKSFFIFRLFKLGHKHCFRYAMSVKFLYVYNSPPFLLTFKNVIYFPFKMPFFFFGWIWVIYPAGCFALWLIASWWCDQTCSSVPCVSWKPALRSRGLIRVAFDFWPEAFVDGVVPSLLYHILMSSRLFSKDVKIDQQLTRPLLMNSLLSSLFPRL